MMMHNFPMISNTDGVQLGIHRAISRMMYLRSRLWPTKCSSSRARSGYTIWHSGQPYKVLPSSAVVKRISPGFGRGFFSFGGFFFFFFFVVVDPALDALLLLAVIPLPLLIAFVSVELFAKFCG